MTVFITHLRAITTVKNEEMENRYRETVVIVALSLEIYVLLDSLLIMINAFFSLTTSPLNHIKLGDRMEKSLNGIGNIS